MPLIVLSAAVCLTLAGFAAQGGSNRSARISGATPASVAWLPVFRNREIVGSERLRRSFRDEVAAAAGAEIDPERSLLIRHPSVVDHPAFTFDPSSGRGTPMASWTIGRLLDSAFGRLSVPPIEGVRSWFQVWGTDTMVGQHPVDRRNSGRIVEVWRHLKRDLALSHMPFRLLAIVNRIDLQDPGRSPGDAGEARFVFSGIEADGVPMNLTVILEYRVNCGDAQGVRQWAKRWANLSTIPDGSPAYIAALRSITEDFSEHFTCGPTGSTMLSQIRTNDQALGSIWQLRDFRPGTGPVRMALLEKTPIRDLLATPDVLRHYMKQFAKDILVNKHFVPETYEGRPFAAGASNLPSAGMRWDVRPQQVDLEVRHSFALNTCNGCHSLETATTFVHIAPRRPGAQSELSCFLQGFSGGPCVVRDPVASRDRKFHDLWRRRRELSFLSAATLEQRRRKGPLLMTH